MDRPPHRVLSLFQREEPQDERPQSTPDKQGTEPRERPKTVSQLVAELRQVIGRDFQGVLIEGEIQEFKIWRGRAGPPRAYFDLKDRNSQLSATIPGDVLARLPFEIEDGMQVLIRGSVAEYRSRLQLVVKRIKPRGEGELALAFRQLREQLTREGLFDNARKKPLPLVPTTVGVVTSGQGAAVKDFIKVLRGRLPGVSIVLSPTLVQGREAAPHVVAALERLDQSARCDVILIGRGGGSLEDLWAFNTQEVVRAIAGCTTPVISAVGHESDTTLADLVADVRAATPSHAAERAVPNQGELEHRLDAFARRLETRARAHKERAELRLRSVGGRLADPRVLLRPAERRLADLGGRLEAATDGALRASQERTQTLAARLKEQSPRVRVGERRRALERVRAELDAAMATRANAQGRALSQLAAKMHALSPLSVLDRGYALVTNTPGGELVPDAARLKAGDRVRVRFRDGQATAVIEETTAVAEVDSADVDSGDVADE